MRIASRTRSSLQASDLDGAGIRRRNFSLSMRNRVLRWPWGRQARLPARRIDPIGVASQEDAGDKFKKEKSEGAYCCRRLSSACLTVANETSQCGSHDHSRRDYRPGTSDDSFSCLGWLRAFSPSKVSPSRTEGGSSAAITPLP